MKYLILLLAVAMPAMAGREFLLASSQHGVGDVSVSSTAVTLAAWVQPKTAVGYRVVLGLTTGVNAGRIAVVVATDSGVSIPTNSLYISEANTAGSATTNTFGGSVPISQWTHVALVRESNSKRVGYVNGVPVCTNNTTLTAPTWAKASVGSRFTGSAWGLFPDAFIAESAVWNVALTADEISSLAAGMSPLLIRPTSRVFYTPLIGQEAGTEWNYDGAPLSLTNSPAPGTSHPRIYRP